MRILKKILFSIASYMELNQARNSALSLNQIQLDKIRSDFPEEIRRIATGNDVDSDVKLMLRNDDNTPIEYVVFILVEQFLFEAGKARQMAQKVHEEGSCIVACGASKESMEHLAWYLVGHAHSRGYPLKWEVINA